MENAELLFAAFAGLCKYIGYTGAFGFLAKAVLMRWSSLFAYLYFNLLIVDSFLSLLLP